MDSLPPEMLVQIFSLLQFHEKHVIRRVSRRLRAVAEYVIAKQDRLIVYEGMLSHVAGNVNGIHVRRLCAAPAGRLTRRKALMFQKITELDMRPVAVCYCTLPKCRYRTHEPQAASLLRKLAPDLVKLFIEDISVMRGIIFPKLKVLNASDSHLTPGTIESCPALEELRADSISESEMRALINSNQTKSQMQPPVRMTVLRIGLHVGILGDDVGHFSHLKHLSLSGIAIITDVFFENMHQLKELKLRVSEHRSVPITFSDTGVRVLLQNNHNLREVTLSGFRLTDRSLHHFADYAAGHGLQELTLKSSLETGFTQPALKRLIAAGRRSILQNLSISNAGHVMINFRP